MSFEVEFLDFMRDTIIRNQLTGYTAYGSPTHSTASSSYACRIVRVHDTITGDDGAEKLIESIVYVASTESFDSQDLFTFPDGSKPILQAMSAYPDEDGAYHHVQLKFGNRSGRV